MLNGVYVILIGTYECLCSRIIVPLNIVVVVIVSASKSPQQIIDKLFFLMFFLMHFLVIDFFLTIPTITDDELTFDTWELFATDILDFMETSLRDCSI